MQYLSPRTLLCLSTVLLALAGCDGDPMETPDSGPGGDAGPGVDSGPRRDGGGGSSTAGTCAMPRTLTAMVGAQTISGNSTNGGTPLDFTGCGATAGAGPQDVVALTLPGTGALGVSFSLVNGGTDIMFDTLVQVRTGACTDAAGALCFDDSGGMELRSSGAFTAMGGSTVYLIVSGFDATNEGAWAMNVTVSNVTAPTITSGTALRVDGVRIDLSVMGGDVDGDVDGVQVSFLDAAGTAIGLDTDGEPTTPDETEFVFGVAEDLTGMMTFTATSRINGLDEFPTLAPATQLRVATVDAFGLVSTTIDIPLTDAMEVGLGAVCDATHVCGDAFSCEAGICALPPAVADACGMATAITIATPTTSATTASVTGTVQPVEGVIMSSCDTDTEGAEVLYLLTVPAGMFDLVATTETSATGAADTVLYVQATCGDPGSETFPGDQVACNDDIDYDMDMLASRLVVQNIAAGTYTIGVETYGIAEAETPFGLDVSLRPVLATGAACDMAGVMNRCAGAACAAGVCP